MRRADREHQIRLTIQRGHKNELERSRLRKRRSHKRPVWSKDSHQLLVGTREIVFAPAIVALTTSAHFEDVALLVKKLRSIALDQRKRVCLDFRRTVEVKAAAMLKLHVELEVISRLRGDDTKAITVRWPLSDDAAAHLFTHGFYGSGISHEGDGHVPITFGTGNEELTAKLKRLNRCLFKGTLVMHEQPWQDLHAAIGEALLNVSHHAYDHPDRVVFEAQFGKAWWYMGNTFDDGQLHIVLFDKGIGISRSLEGKDARVVRVLKRFSEAATGTPSDAKMIKAATIYGASRLKTKYDAKSGRGKGLADIINWVKKNPEGVLTVFSNRGLYRYESATGKITMTDMPYSIHGTLIQWNAELSLSEQPQTAGG